MSSSVLADIVVFTNFRAVSLLKPDCSSLSNVFIAILLLFLASGPEPIPSLIASKYLPSSSLVCNVVSPDIIEPNFFAFASPTCIVNSSSDVNVYMQVLSFTLSPHLCFCKTIFSLNTFAKIRAIFLTPHSFPSTESHTPVYNVIMYLPLSSCFTVMSFNSISFSSSNFFTCSFWVLYISSSSFVIWFAKFDRASDTPFNWLDIVFLFSSSFFFHIKFNLLTLYAEFIALTISSISFWAT